MFDIRFNSWHTLENEYLMKPLFGAVWLVNELDGWYHGRYMYETDFGTSLLWCHNGRHGVSNHQPHDCLLYRSSRRRSTKTSKFRVTGFCAGISSVVGEFPAQMARNAINVSIWWRHHAIMHGKLPDMIVNESTPFHPLPVCTNPVHI